MSCLAIYNDKRNKSIDRQPIAHDWGRKTLCDSVHTVLLNEACAMS